MRLKCKTILYPIEIYNQDIEVGGGWAGRDRRHDGWRLSFSGALGAPTKEFFLDIHLKGSLSNSRAGPAMFRPVLPLCASAQGVLLGDPRNKTRSAVLIGSHGALCQQMVDENQTWKDVCLYRFHCNY